MRLSRPLIGCVILTSLAGLSWALAPPQQNAAKSTGAEKSQKPGAAKTPDAASSDDEKLSPAEVAARAEAELIGKAAKRFTEAYNQHDSKELASAFTAEGELIDEDGNVTRGRAAIAANFAEVFKAFPELSIEVDIDSIEILGSNIAFEEGVIHAKATADDLPAGSRFVALYVKQDGQWLILRSRDFHNDADAGTLPTNYDRLSELEWMVGDWADESQGSLVLSSCKWVDDKNYLLQEFQMRVAGETAMSGSMRIGWDPLSGQIKSWVFDSLGGYSEGLWTRLDATSWLVVSRGATRDREISTSTMTYRVVDDSTATWEARDRIIGGEIQDEVPIVTVKRRAPPPAP